MKNLIKTSRKRKYVQEIIWQGSDAYKRDRSECSLNTHCCNNSFTDGVCKIYIERLAIMNQPALSNFNIKYNLRKPGN